MSWTPLPKGCFTSIDWAPRDATRGYDPYLVWAECDRFAGYGGRVPHWLPVAIELREGVSIAQFEAAGSTSWLRVPALYTSDAVPAGFRFCTAQVRPEFFQALQQGGPIAGLVQRLELGLQAQEEGNAPEAVSAKPPRAQPTPRRLTGKVFGLIDDSLAVAHRNFLAADGSPRTAYLWRQDGRGKGPPPAGLRYGHEVTRSDIAAAIDRSVHGGLVDEGAVYVDLGLSTLGQCWPKGKVQFHTLDTSVSHGSHVADLAVGPRRAQAQIANLPPGFDAPPSWALANDDASRCPIVAVQLDHQTVKDTSGGSMNVHVLDGLVYILSRCAPDAEVTVNISFGTLAGPHDGTALLERAMAQLIALCGGRLQIALAAGNSYQLRTHANVPLATAAREVLRWRVQPGDSTPSFLELWIEQDRQDVQIELLPPGASAPLAACRLGESGMWVDQASGQPLCALVYPSAVATGERGTCALLAVAPTFAFSKDVATAPAGVWRIVLTNRGSQPVVIDAYVERDDVVIGTRSGARQSHLEDDPWLAWDQQYDMSAWVDDPRRTTPIRRSGNFNSIATGAGIHSVGGRRFSDDAWAHYSPRFPDPDASRPSRPGVVKMPNAWGGSDENPALTGLKAAGTRSGAVPRLAGTSDAAPQVARRLLNGEATSGPEASSST
jgi:hypothetical protein